MVQIICLLSVTVANIVVNVQKVATTVQVAVFLIYIQTFAENIQNAQVSADRRIDEIATNSNDNNNTDTEWCEVEERPSGVTDTLLQQPDITEI